ncbi:MAG: PfkB family carbohydrate kinase, partial [Candidatus Ornithospirochaeta sp.]
SQNEIIVVLGASETISEDEIEEMFSHMDGVEFLLLQLEINIDALSSIVEKACSRGIKVILNPAPARQLDDSIFPMLYAITPNEVEAEVLSGVAYGDETDIRPMADAFRKKGVRNVIITLGKSGCYLLDESGKEYRFSNYDDIEVLDSTGAGDAFNGGLLAALGEGKTLPDAVHFANIVSNLSVTRLGTSTSMPWRMEINEFMMTHDFKCQGTFHFDPMSIHKE